MTKRIPVVVYDYPILMPFRHNGRWWKVEDKTIKLAPRQTPFLLRSGKIGPRTSGTLSGDKSPSDTVTKSVPAIATQTKKEVKNG